MLNQEEWFDLARKLDWEFSYVQEKDVFPPEISGKPWLPHSVWKDWDEPFKTTYENYVRLQSEKDTAITAIREAIGNWDDFAKLSPAWLNGLKLHVATLALAEFAAVVGNMRAARFAKDSAWRTACVFGAMDELRHTQIPLLLMHELVKWDIQFDWTHKFYHTNNWVAIAARHLVDELLILSDPIEFAIATNFVFETGFTNLQFIGFSSMAHDVGDKMFEKMIQSIQTDEARHAQIGPAVLKVIVQHDKEYAQYLLDKWFWRSWQLFAVVTGFCMDYLTPLAARKLSFKEFMQEWVLEQFLESLAEFDLKLPWYWPQFMEALDSYHHMVYVSAYTYRATVWFDFVIPGPEERAWLNEKYPKYWNMFEPIWQRIADKWAHSRPGVDFSVHGTAIVTFCHLCQMVLCGGTPAHNHARVFVYNGKKHIFCSEPCLWIFKSEPEKYAHHKDIVSRVLAGEAPGNVMKLISKYFSLDYDSWGKDAFGGEYSWLKR